MKVLWDFKIRTDKVILAQRPDMVVIDKTKRTNAVIDVAVPLGWKVKDKEDENILKYHDLKTKVKKLWKTKAKVMPIIVGLLGATSMKFKKDFMEIPGNIIQQH